MFAGNRLGGDFQNLNRNKRALTLNLKKPEGLEVITDEGLKQALNPLPGQSLVQACQLTPEEIDKITQEIEREQQSDYLLTLVQHLIEILLHLGEDMDAYENMISYFERLLDSLLDQGEVRNAVAI